MVRQSPHIRYIIKYTFLFCILAAVVYGYFIIYNKSFVDSNQAFGDGLVQHYQALCYYAEWLRDIAKTLLFEHRLVIPEWSFSIGYGSDVITTLHYYVIGDPFNLLSVFCPLKYMPYYYGFMILLRLYFAGLAFSSFSFYMTKEDPYPKAVLAGSFFYIFCMYGMRSGITHPYFINPMIYFPLLLLGVEKILRREKPFLFIGTVCIGACSNFYFFYMLVIMTVLYVVMRLFRSYGIKKLRIILSQILKVGLYSILGLAMASVIFLPVALTAIQDSRFGSSHVVGLFYPAEYYSLFPAGFLTFKSPGYWSVMGYAAIGLVAVFLMFRRRKQFSALKTAFSILTLMLLFPVFSYILNAFAYPAGRWIWAYSFLIAFVIVKTWPLLLNTGKSEQQWLFITITGYFLLCFLLQDSRTAHLAFCIAIAFITVFILQLDFKHPAKTRRIKEYLLLFTLFFNIGMNAWFLFSIKNSNYTEKYVDLDKVNSTAFETQDVAVAQASAGDSNFFRYSHYCANNNSTLHSGLHSLQYYWSLSNSSIVESNNTLGILGRTHNNYLDLNCRAGLTTLANVCYFADAAGKGTQYAPFGFNFAGTYSADKNGKKNWDVYKNNYSLPFGYTYRSVLNHTDFEKLSMVQKEDAMLQGALLDQKSQETSVFTETDVILQDSEIAYNINCDSEEITVQGDSFVTTSKDSTATLTFSGMANCETYLIVEGLEYSGCSPLELYKDTTPYDPLNLYTEKEWEHKSAIKRKKEKNKYRNWSEKTIHEILVSGTDEQGQTVTQQMYYYTPEYTWYSGKDDFAVNLGYSSTAKTSIQIKFPEAGIYSYDNLTVVCRPMSDYPEYINELKESHLENVVFSSDNVKGDIQLDTDKILCMTIPYSNGWSAYVDGKKAEMIKTNLMYSGLILSPGYHEIELVYHTPGLRIGFMISLIGISVTIFLYVLQHHRQKRIPDLSKQ